MHRVLLTDSIARAGEEALERGAEVVRSPDADPATIRRYARDVDGVIIRSKLPDDIFEAAPRLRAVVVHGTGTDLVPVADATARGVMVANIPGANAQSVAEYCAMAMMLLSRNMVFIIESFKNKKPWDDVRRLASENRELAALTLGIVGVGAIGTHLAKIARRGFGMRVLGTQRRLDRIPADAEPMALEPMVRASDFVVIACPLTPETRHLFNPERLGWMKTTSWLINVGRGPVVDQKALVDALRAKRIAGAMLDVYEQYRLAPDDPLFSLDNVILTPHLAAVTRESRARASVAAAEEMLRMLAGERPRNFVNPEAAKR